MEREGKGRPVAYRQRSSLRILTPRFKEPEKDMLINIYIRITTITLHIRVKLANARRDLLVADWNACVAGGIDEVRWSGHELCQSPAGREGEEESETHDEDLGK
jgi:hypothetical protein